MWWKSSWNICNLPLNSVFQWQWCSLFTKLHISVSLTNNNIYSVLNLRGHKLCIISCITSIPSIAATEEFTVWDMALSTIKWPYISSSTVKSPNNGVRINQTCWYNLLFLSKIWDLWFCAPSLHTRLLLSGNAQNFRNCMRTLRTRIYFLLTIWIPIYCKSCYLEKVLWMKTF